MHTKHGPAARILFACGRAAVVAAALAMPAIAQAQTAGLKYFRNYFLTGDYVTGAVALKDTGVNGVASGGIAIQGVPADAEVVAAFLYWQTVTATGNPGTMLDKATFRGQPLKDVARVVNPAGSSPCWSNGGSTGSANGSKAIYVYRADVLPFLPRVRPADRTKPVTTIVNATHDVTLPDMGGSNQLPSTLGATLVVVWRQPGYTNDVVAGVRVQKAKQPLRSIVIFDGGYTMDNQTRGLSVTLEGFYQASSASNASTSKITQIVGNGQANFYERVRIQTDPTAAARLVAENPFNGTSAGTATGWDTVTFTSAADGSALLPAGTTKARLTVDGGTSGSFDCLTWGAVVMATDVQDRDQDGLVDVWEKQSEWTGLGTRGQWYASWPLTDPTGVPLPNLEAMGANPDVQDVFVEIDYMVGNGHSHLPAKEALDQVARAFRNAARRPSLPATPSCPANAARGQCPINVHFDVGTNYQGGWTSGTASLSRCASATTWTPDCAIVPAALADGGDAIDEVPCRPNPDPQIKTGLTPSGRECRFPGTPGVVGWKSGFRALRDGPKNAGCTQPGCAQRFAKNRKDIFRYALFGHAFGYPSVLDAQKPRKTSGVADSYGADILVTLGLWDNQTGTPFVQGATLMHELGHTFGLRHGGVGPLGPQEPNCKPNYQSVMNYLFQIRGLLTANGTPTLDFSSRELGVLSEGALQEPSGLGTTDYMARWYAPRSTSFLDNPKTGLNTSPATRRCDGSLITDGSDYVRVDADPRLRGTSGVGVDWNGDGTLSGTSAFDANFDGDRNDGANGPALTGSNDFLWMDLRQIGGRRSTGSAQLSQDFVDPASGAAGGAISLDTGYGVFGWGDLGWGDLGYADAGWGDLGWGDLGWGDLGWGDLGWGDLGWGDLGVPEEEGAVVGTGDLDLDTAGSLANAPSGLTATAVRRAVQLDWLAPHVGEVLGYQVYRVEGASVTPANFATKLLVCPLSLCTSTSILDSGVKNNVTYTYFVIATLVERNPDGTVKSTIQSGVSNFVTIKY